MKFLKKRDNYLQTLNERREIQINERFERILENQAGSGVMGNEIKWGDCLLGRLLSNIVRKSQVGANLVRIKPVVSRLKSAMDELLIGSGFNDLEGRDKALFNLALVSEYLDVLKVSVQNYGTPDAVDEFDTLEEIKGLVKDTVSKLEGTTATPYLGTGFENKNEIIRQLKKLEKHLNTLKEPEDKKDDKDQDQDQDQDQNVDSDDTVKQSALVNQVTKKAGLLYSKNFIHVINLYFMALSSNTANPKAQEMIKKQIEQLEAQIKTTTDPAKKKQLEDKLVSLKVKTNRSIGESMIFENVSNVGTSLKNLIQVFSKQLGKEEAKKELKELKGTLEKGGGNSQIIKIYEQIRNEEGLETKIHESVDQLLNDTKGISSAIRGLYGVVKAKSGLVDDPNISPEIKKEFKLFFDTMKPCLALDLYMVEKQPKEEKSEETKESLVLKYNGFVKMIREEVTMNSGQTYFNQNQAGGNQAGGNQAGGNQAGGNQAGGNQGAGNQGAGNQGGAGVVSGAAGNVDDKDQTLKEFADDLRDWWDKNLDIDQYIFSKQDAEKAKEQLDKKLAAAKDSIVIDGMDPVLEIVKCFNRAYKIHTTQVIPSGRTGGSVTNRIFMEYTCFGSGTPQNAGESGGPYRNNKLFDLWESNVLDVLKEKKYQKIFSPDTRLKVGNDYIEKAGSNLRKFMTDMLNGDEFYGKGGDSKGGLQAKFLDKYFGYKDGDDAKNTHFEGISERENNQSNTPDAIECVKVDAGKELDEVKAPSELVGSFFSILYKQNDYTHEQYFYIQEYRDGNYYVSFCKTIYHMKMMLQKGSAGRTYKFSTEKFKTQTLKEDGNGPYLISCTRMPQAAIKGGAFDLGDASTDCGFIQHDYEKEGSDRPNNCNEGDKYKTIAKQTWQIQEINWIVDSSNNKRVKVNNIEKAISHIEDEGGFEKISTIDGINSVSLRRG